MDRVIRVKAACSRLQEIIVFVGSQNVLLPCSQQLFFLLLHQGVLILSQSGQGNVVLRDSRVLTLG